jgi:outer membrane lipoprotein-sorting protein
MDKKLVKLWFALVMSMPMLAPCTQAAEPPASQKEQNKKRDVQKVAMETDLLTRMKAPS